ncbi:MAG: penicillin-binding protein activator [Sinobacteraceae bacterium]|nr:penicillin-binding protein activator [Nevskiaceae bacterium]
MLETIHPAELKAGQQARYHLLKARLAMAQGHPQAALAALPRRPKDPDTAPDMLKLRGEALFALQRPVPATQALVDRAPLLRNIAALQHNASLIWQGLTGQALTPDKLNNLSAATKTTRGWIKLALLAQSGASMQQYTAWQSRFPHHPATTHLAQLLVTAGGGASRNATFPATVQLPPVGAGPAALLLPTNGPLAAAAQAVREGFNAALSRAGYGPARVYNVGTGGLSMSQAVSQALTNGAGIIVGPLQKSAVVELNRLGDERVPVIALNYLNTSTTPAAGLLQFGLSPDDEARQAVTHAARQGLHRVLALVPDSARGSSILAALRQQINARNGRLVAALQYPQGTTDFSSLISQLLDIDASKTRDKAVANALGRWPKFEPRRRQDIDFIFISGTPTADRLMVSTFRYWRASRVPVYATADVNTGQGNHDLNGVRFCGMPWKLEPGSAWDTVRQRLLAGVGGNQQLIPLYALGLDAGRLALRLRNGGLQAGEELSGYTGELSIGPTGVVQRRLACAKATLEAPETLPGPPLPVPGAVDASVHPAPELLPQQPQRRPSLPSQAFPRFPQAGATNGSYGNQTSPASQTQPPGAASPAPSGWKPSPPL